MLPGGAYNVLAQRQTVCRISHTAVAGKKSTRLSKSFTTMPIRHSFKMPAGVCRCTYCDKSSKGKAAHRARTFPLPKKHPTPPRTAYALLFLTVCSDEKRAVLLRHAVVKSLHHLLLFVSVCIMQLVRVVCLYVPALSWRYRKGRASPAPSSSELHARSLHPKLGTDEYLFGLLHDGIITEMLTLEDNACQ